LARGRTHVIEFWATWCGPCRTSIPHLTDLQKKYPGVTFIGVSVLERDSGAVKPFVKEMGAKMGYTVATDAVPPGMPPTAGEMAVRWMAASGNSGLPMAFIVNPQGKLAWIGHPMLLDQPLAKVVAGKWDVKTAAAEQKAAEARERRLADLATKVQAAQQAGNRRQELALIERAIAADSQVERLVAPRKLQLLCRTGRAADAARYAGKLVDRVYPNDPEGLYAVAWSLVDPKGPRTDVQVGRVALKAALRADALTKQTNPAVADALARAYFVTGDPKSAVRTQERALNVARGVPDSLAAEWKARLEEYRKAAGK